MQEDIELFRSYARENKMYLIKFEFEHKVIDYCKQRQDIVMYFGEYPHYPEEKLLEVTFEGCSRIEMSDCIYNILAQYCLIFEDISDRGFEDLKYYVYDTEYDIMLYCHAIQCKIV